MINMMKNLFKRVLCVCLVAIMAATVFAADMTTTRAEVLDDGDYDPDEEYFAGENDEKEDDGYDEFGVPEGTGQGKKVVGSDKRDSYYCREAKTGVIDFTVSKKSREGLINFDGKNKQYYKIVITGIKHSKTVDFRFQNTCDDFYDNCLDRRSGTIPVKNGKVVCYMKPFESGDDSIIDWVYQKDEKDVHVKAIPMSKSEAKKSTTIKASKSKVTVTKKNQSIPIVIRANEPISIRLKGGKNAYDCIGKDRFKINEKTGAVTVITRLCTSGVMEIRGLCTGKVVKVKIHNTFTGDDYKF